MNLIATDFLKYKLGSGRKCPISSTEVCGKRSLLQVWDGEIPPKEQDSWPRTRLCRVLDPDLGTKVELHFPT